jgi:hypothetical protein
MVIVLHRGILVFIAAATGAWPFLTIPIPVRWSGQVDMADAVKTGILATLTTGLGCLWMYVVYRRQHPVPVHDHTKWSSDRNEVISERTFWNESVVVDGKTFNKCRFVNATFVYHGLANATFLTCKFEQGILVKTDNQAVRGYQELCAFIETLPGSDSGRYGTMDDSGSATFRPKTSRDWSGGGSGRGDPPRE